MVTQQDNPTKTTEVPLTDTIKDSAQQIWQAGLGAFNKAQVEGSKAFEALVKEGVTLQRKTQSAAEERLSEASSKMAHMATDISAKASGQWDKLETIFEDRVAKALNKLGVPSAQDIDALTARIDALTARIDELNKRIEKLSAKAVVPKAAPRKATRTVVKPPVKRASSRRTTDVISPD